MGRDEGRGSACRDIRRMLIKSGKDISACICLAGKPGKTGVWSKEEHDEDFEDTSKWAFVTGVSADGVGEAVIKDLQPVKHGVARGVAKNWRRYDLGGLPESYKGRRHHS